MAPYTKLQQIIGEQTDTGCAIIRFLHDTMQGILLNRRPEH